MLAIIGFVIVIVATYYAYKTAKDYGRNAILWAVATFCIGFGIQFIVPMIIGLVLAIIWMAQGTTNPVEMQSRLIGPAFFIGIGCLILSVIAMGIILKKVSQVPDEPIVSGPPPPPAEFQ